MSAMNRRIELSIFYEVVLYRDKCNDRAGPSMLIMFGAATSKIKFVSPA